MSDGEWAGNQQNNERCQKIEMKDETPSVKKGRFFIENAKGDAVTAIKKNGLGIYHPEGCLESKLILEIIEKQNELIETIFDMVGGLGGDEKLFHKEFTVLSASVCEKIEKLRSLYGNSGCT